MDEAFLRDFFNMKPKRDEITVRDMIACACLPSIYASVTQLTDRAADLAYEQADEMLRARKVKP